MQIVIIRHGLPNMFKWKKIRAGQMVNWISWYDKAGINEAPIDVRNKMAALALDKSFIVCSDLVS